MVVAVRGLDVAARVIVCVDELVPQRALHVITGL
jgi:hypothetical protein